MKRRPYVRETTPVSLREGCLVVKIILSAKEKAAAYALRHRVFCRSFGWVQDCGCGLEVDMHDADAVSVGVFGADGRLRGYARLVLPPAPFMLEEEFKGLIRPDGQLYKGPDTAEVSRLCVAPGASAPGAGGRYGVAGLILKGLHAFCRVNGIRFLYAVTGEGALRLYGRMGLTLDVLSGPVRLDGGMPAYAVSLDWDELARAEGARQAGLYVWLQSISTSPSDDAIAAA